MATNTKTAAHTLNQVRDILDKVADHKRLGKEIADSILEKHGGGAKQVKLSADSVHARDLKPRFYGKVFEACQKALAELPSAADEELIDKIDAAVIAQERASDALVERDVELGKLLIEAFHRYPTERPFRNFLRYTAFSTYKRAAELMFAAGGRKEGEELQRLLKRGADNTRNSRRNNSPAPKPKPAITSANVIAGDNDNAEGGDSTGGKKQWGLAGSAATEVPIEDRETQMDKLALTTSPAPKKADPDTATLIANKEATSKAALERLTAAFEELRAMTTADKQEAWNRFTYHPAMEGVKRAARVGKAA